LNWHKQLPIDSGDHVDFIQHQINLNISEDVQQDNENPAHFMFYENGEYRELWHTYMGNQHLHDYMATTNGAVEEFTINEMSRLV
jgi:quinol monooxygenase YgiN